MLAITSGMGVSVAAAVGLLVAIVFIDYSFGLQKLPRLLLIMAALGSLGYVLWHWLMTPALSKLDIGDVAGRLEHTFPQFDDRLRSTVNFSRSEIPGSRVMQDRVVSEAQSLAGQVNLHRVIVRRPVYYSALAALGSVALLAVLVSWGNHAGWLKIAADRLLLGNDQWPKSVEIAVDEQLPQRVAVGQRIPVKIHLTKGDKDSRKAFIYYRYDDGPEQMEIMTRKDGAYTALLDARLEQGHKNANLHVRLVAGDDDKSLSAVSVVPRLQIQRVDADLTPPPYVQPSIVSTVSLTERAATTAYGSKVALQLHFNKPLKEGAPVEIRSIKLGQKLPAFTWDRATPGLAIATFQADGSFRFTVKATDSDGFQNPGGEEFELMVKEDQPPSVQIEEPKRSEERTPNAGFDVKAMAEDDYGILGAQLIVDRVSGGEKSADPAHKQNGASQNHWLVDLVKGGIVAADNTSWEAADSSPERKRYHLGYHWELASLKDANLKPGDVLEFYIQVKDNFSLNGKEHDWVPSGKLRITIISLDDYLKQKQAEAELIQGQIKAEQLGQLRQKAETDNLKQGLDRNKKFDDADKTQANRLANDQASTQSQTMQLADRLAQMTKEMAENKAPEAGLKQTAAEVEKELRQAADSPMREAKKNLDASKDAPQDPKANADQQNKDAEQRAGQMQKASENQQAAADQLKKAMDKLGEMDGLAGAIESIQKALDDQKKLEKEFQEANKNNIGKNPDELSKQDKEQNKKQSDAQNEQSKQLADKLDKMAAKADKMSKSDPSASDAMKQAAQMGKSQGLPSKQQQAAQDMQQNQQAQAQQNQRQVELGLDQILNKLREAERKRLEELARQLSQMQQLIAELIQRQAGHNIDNLLIQGGVKRLEKIESKGREELIGLAGRDPKNLPPAIQLDQLTPSQEQTQRNAASIAKQAESLPDPAPAAKLTQAAGQMERAIVHLRSAKLAEAYQPPQVDALASLLEAKKEVDKAKDKVDKQTEEQNEETIKQAYVELLKEQKKVGAELKKIVDIGKDPNDLPREDAVRLAQLPGQQGELIDKAEKIGEKIKQLDSVVYDWANKDIMKSMGKVKDNLAKPDTGKPTQVAELHTEAQLQAMIDSLVQKKKDAEFAQRQGGGKGGQGSPKAKLPTEAELRLLKKNQEEVHDSTIGEDAKKEKDKENLLSLSTRQSDLRNLLDLLIQKATQGQQKLGPPPDPKDQLPEESNKELQDDLLNDKANDKTVDTGERLTGDRMARSAQRLAKNDPGAMTQEIQKRIIIDIDALIKMAQQQQQSSQSKPGKGKGQQQGEPQQQPGQGPQQVAQGKPGQPKQGGQTPAEQSSLSKAANSDPDLNARIKETMEQWGKITQRDRRAVQEGAGEEVIGKYQKLVEDYYRSLAEQASKQ
jgi:hypothetical protein